MTKLMSSFVILMQKFKFKQFMGNRGRRDREHMVVGFTTTMVVGFTTTYAISAYHSDVLSLNLDQGEVYNIM